MRNRPLLGGLFGVIALALVLASCDLLGGSVPTPAPVIGTPTPASLSYDLLLGAIDDSKSFSFTNTGDADLPFSVAVSAGASWLTIDSGDASGTLAPSASHTVDLSATCTDLVDKVATVTISDTSTVASSKTVGVVLTCRSPSSSSLFLAANVGDPAASDTFSFLNSDAAAQAFTVSGLPAWLTATPTSGTVAAGASQDIDFAAAACAASSVQEASVDITFSDSGTARAAVLTPLTVDVFQVCSAAAGAFDIQLLFFGNGFTAATLAPFLSAEERWEDVISGDIEGINGFNWPADDCSFNEPSFGTFDIDDVAIAVKVGDIDGASGILARAGPCRIRVSGPNAPLTVTGVMEFDSADIASFGDLETVVLHEMGHVIGIGTLWDNKGLLDFTPPGGGTTAECLGATDPNFTGAGALAQYDALLGGGSGATGVPVANAGGAGTQCAHWDEQDFDSELMTGYVENAGSNPMSAMTIASLADIGYTVDLGAADAYALPGCSPNCDPGLPALQDGSVLDLGAGEVLLRPIGGVTPDGRKVPLD